MKQRYTDKELRERLSGLTVICDTREQCNGHILSAFAANKIPYETQTLKTGDYSFAADGQYFDDEILVERKGSLDELAGNYTIDRERFEREFIRAKAQGIKVFLLIEDSSYTDIWRHNYISKLAPKSLLASLCAWQVRYNVTVLFCRKDESATLIYTLMYHWYRERLING